jgi:hypothetical protein
VAVGAGVLGDAGAAEVGGAEGVVLGVSTDGAGPGSGAVFLPVCHGAVALGFWGVAQGFWGAVQGFWGAVQGCGAVVAGVLAAVGFFHGAETGAWFPSPGDRGPPLSRQSPQARGDGRHAHDAHGEGGDGYATVTLLLAVLAHA